MTRGFDIRLIVWSLVALSVLRATFAQSASGETPAPDGAFYWIFLTTGKSTQGLERSEIATMQEAHLANFGRLYREGKLFAAGPLADPQKKLRGIVVVTSPDPQSLPELFEPDPYVKHGYMIVDAISMEVAVGKFQTNVDPSSFTEYRLVLLEKSMPDGEELDREAENKNLAYCQSIHDTERLCFAGWLSEDKLPRRGILIFRKLDDAMLESLVNELPAVKSRTWKATTFPLYMNDGIVK